MPHPFRPHPARDLAAHFPYPAPSTPDPTVTTLTTSRAHPQSQTTSSITAPRGSGSVPAPCPRAPAHPRITGAPEQHTSYRSEEPTTATTPPHWFITKITTSAAYRLRAHRPKPMAPSTARHRIAPAPGSDTSRRSNRPMQAAVPTQLPHGRKTLIPTAPSRLHARSPGP